MTAPVTRAVPLTRLPMSDFVHRHCQCVAGHEHNQPAQRSDERFAGLPEVDCHSGGQCREERAEYGNNAGNSRMPFSEQRNQPKHKPDHRSDRRFAPAATEKHGRTFRTRVCNPSSSAADRIRWVLPSVD